LQQAHLLLQLLLVHQQLLLLLMHQHALPLNFGIAPPKLGIVAGQVHRCTR
jgi:hypothetical protein